MSTNFIVDNGLVCHLDPLNSESYKGTGLELKNIKTGSVQAVFGNLSKPVLYENPKNFYDSKTGSIDLINNDSNMYANNSFLRVSNLTSISTLSFWLRLNGRPNATFVYLMDGRTSEDASVANAKSWIIDRTDNFVSWAIGDDFGGSTLFINDGSKYVSIDNFSKPNLLWSEI